MWHLVVVLLDEKLHKSSEPLNRVEGVEVKPLVFQRPPERLDHRGGVGNIDLGEDAPQAGAEQGGVYRAVDVLDAGVSEQKRPTREYHVLASGEKKLAGCCGLQPLGHRPRENLSGVVVDDGVQICLGPIKQLEDRQIHMPNLIGCGRAYADGGFGRMNALPRPKPAALYTSDA